MKTQQINSPRGYTPRHPDRTAYKELGSLTSPRGIEYVAQEWPNRASMARSIRMQAQREHRPSDWTPFVKLSDGEGY